MRTDFTPWQVPLAMPMLGRDEEEAVLRALHDRWLALGPETEALEAEFASMFGVSHAIAVSSATAALHLAFMALGVGPRDEVIQPSINSPSAANMTVAVGAEPAFADIQAWDRPRIGISQIEEAWTSRATAVVVSHYGGVCCDMPAIREYCRQQDLYLVEDAWHSLGAVCEGRLAGTWGDFGCFSFMQGAGSVAGGGGMLVTSRDDLAARARALRSHGFTGAPASPVLELAEECDIEASGFNYCLDELRAAVARVQLEKLDVMRARRRDNALMYSVRLADCTGLSIVDRLNVQQSACHIMSVLVGPGSRMRVRRALQAAGIETGWHYPCLAEASVFRDTLRPEAVANSIEFAKRQITLPLYPALAGDLIKRVCESLSACEPAVTV